jgi:IS4 transposase
MTDQKVCPKEDIITTRLLNLFQDIWLREAAGKTGFIKRERKIKPEIFFWVLVLGYGVSLQRSLVELKRAYERGSKTKLSDSSWYYRFTPELVEFLHQCVIHGIKQQAKESCRTLNSRLNGFLDVCIQDSTVIRLNKALAKKWPAARSRTVAAGIKVGLLVSAIANGPKNVAIMPERTSELKTLRIGSWVKNRIILIDLGFYKFGLFSKISSYGGYFVSRMKSNANPTILSLNKGCNLDESKIKGLKLSDVLKNLKGEALDAQIEVSYKKDISKNSKKLILEEFRLVAIYNTEAEKYHVYITNISNELLIAQDIADLYRGRWEIELIFKELKSKYQLDVIESRNERIIEALIWISILTLIVSRFIYKLIREINPDRPMIRFTQLRWSNAFIGASGEILNDLLRYLGVTNLLTTRCEIYGSQALDPHVNRDRFRDNLWA